MNPRRVYYAVKDSRGIFWRNGSGSSVLDKEKLFATKKHANILAKDLNAQIVGVELREITSNDQNELDLFNK